jgi:outer membrane biogenesis lipoprotein LolB
MSAAMKPKIVTVRRKKIELQIDREQLSYHLQKGWHLEVQNYKSEMVEATPEQIDEMLSP